MRKSKHMGFADRLELNKASLRTAVPGLLAVLLAVGATFGQNAADSGIKPNYVMGEVSRIDVAARHLVVRTGGGEVVAVFNEQTLFVKIPPGETSLEKAEPITLEEVGVGDKVLAQGKVAADQKSLPARRIIVMTKASIAEKHDRDKMDWSKRGVSGLVQSLDVAKRALVIKAHTAEGAKDIALVPSDKTDFRRYAGDSVRFSDARTSKLEEIKVGDLVRALGDKSADGLTYRPEVVVSGSFMMAGGPVTKVMPESGEVVIQNLVTKKPLTVVIGKESVVRRLPPPLANMLAARLYGGTGSSSNGASNGNAPSMLRTGEGRGGKQLPEGPAGGQAVRSPDQPGPGAPGEGSAGGMRAGGGMGPGGNGRGRMMTGDLSEAFDRLPPITVAEIPIGELILVSCAASADAEKATAIMLAAGAEPILTQPAQAGGTANYSFPSGVLDMGVGLGMGGQ